MSKESVEPGKEHHRSLSGTQPPPSGRLSHRVVDYGWDEYSLLVLSVILTGTLPLAVTSWIAIGAILWNWDAISEWLAIVMGFVAAAGVAALQYRLLRLITSERGRSIFIPRARSLFPRCTMLLTEARSGGLP